MKRLGLSALLLLSLVAPAAAEDAHDLVRTFLDAPDAATRQDLAAKIVAAAPPVADVAAWLAEGRTYAADVPTGWLERKNRCLDGVERNYLLFVPKDYDPAKRYRLVVDMHGGVSRPQMLSHAELGQMKFFWGEHAEENGYLLAIPAGQQGAEWWTPVGSDNVLGVIRSVKREYDVDENRIVATGFSDGGSGTYYLALTDPTPFSAFVPLNGHLAVTQAGGLQTHLLNLLNKPLYIVNTANDSLYPSASVKPIIDALQPLGASLVWRDIPEYTHNPMYLPAERPAIWTWMQEQVRTPHPKQVVWQGTEGAPSRVHWLRVTELSAANEDVASPDPNPGLLPGRVLIGVTVDQTFSGPGARIDEVTEGSPGAAAGVKAGDVIVGFDAVDIATLPDLRRALGGKTFGDSFQLRVKRGEETLTLEGAFPKPEASPVFRREKPWSAIEATVEGNTIHVKARRVGAFELYLSDALVDLAVPVVVEVNGTTVHEGLVAPDLGFLLAQAAEDDDRTMVYAAKLTIGLTD